MKNKDFIAGKNYKLNSNRGIVYSNFTNIVCNSVWCCQTKNDDAG